MTAASDNIFPKIIVAEGSAPSSPSAGDFKLYVDSADHLFKMKNSAGTVTTFGAGLADPMTTRGDIIVRDSSNTTARLAKGSAGRVLTSDGTDVAWGNGPLTTKGDLIVGGASGALSRLGVGTDGDVLTLDSGQSLGVKWAAASGGGGLTQAFVGYNTVGGSNESMTSGRWYAKKITTTGACELRSVEAYINQQTSTNAHAFSVAVWDDNSTKPGLLLTAAMLGANGVYAAVLNKNSAPGTARWFGLPVGIHLAASTSYWIGFMVILNAGTFNLAYDTSGTDRYMTASGQYATDWDYFTDNSTTNKYSIRGNTIA